MTTEAPAAPAAPAAAPVIAAQTDPNATAAPGTETPPVEQQPPRTFSQDELNEAIEKRLAKERRKREELQRRLAVTEELALRGRREDQPAKQDAQPADNGEPKREQFETYEAYIEARADWRADRKVEERLNKQRDDDARDRTAAEQQKLEKQFRERAQVAAKGIEDFEDVMEASEAPMTRAMAEAILTSDVGPNLAYHLAKNPEEAERIAALPAARQAAEIGKLEAKLAAEPPKETKKPSKAPDPIKPVGARSTVADDMPDPKTKPAEWLKWRNAQLRKK